MNMNNGKDAVDFFISKIKGMSRNGAIMEAEQALTHLPDKASIERDAIHTILLGIARAAKLNEADNLSLSILLDMSNPAAIAVDEPEAYYQKMCIQHKVIERRVALQKFDITHPSPGLQSFKPLISNFLDAVISMARSDLSLSSLTLLEDLLTQVSMTASKEAFTSTLKAFKDSLSDTQYEALEHVVMPLMIIGTTMASNDEVMNVALHKSSRSHFGVSVSAPRLFEEHQVDNQDSSANQEDFNPKPPSS